MAQHYVNETSQPNRPDKSKIWTKISAHSNVKVASEKVKEFEHAKMQGLRKAPAIPTYCMVWNTIVPTSRDHGRLT